MRNKKAKPLRKISKREAPHENELISNIMKKYKVTLPDEKEPTIINRITMRYNKLSPRATYQRIKRLYKATPRNQRAGLLENR